MRKLVAQINDLGGMVLYGRNSENGSYCILHATNIRISKSDRNHMAFVFTVDIEMEEISKKGNIVAYIKSASVDGIDPFSDIINIREMDSAKMIMAHYLYSWTVSLKVEQVYYCVGHKHKVIEGLMTWDYTAWEILPPEEELSEMFNWLYDY